MRLGFCLGYQGRAQREMYGWPPELSSPRKFSLLRIGGTSRSATLTQVPVAASAASTSGKIRNIRSSREVSKIERKVSCRPLRKNFPPYASTSCMARISAATPCAIDISRAGKIYHYPFRFFLDHCVKIFCDGRRNVQIDIAFKRQDIRAVLTQHRSGWGSVFSHSILSSSLHYPLGVSLG